MTRAPAPPESDQHTILVVDDMPANLELTANYLEQHNFRVLVAQTGEAAIKRAQLIVPNLILLDVMMPGMDGFETCRRLKAIDLTCDIPVIFMTGLTDLHDKIAGFAAGGVDYLTRPFQVEELFARVKIHLALQTIKRKLWAQNAQLKQEAAMRLQVEENLRDILAKQQRAQALRVEQGRALEMIATGSPLEQVLDSLVQVIESQSEGAMGSIQLLSEDGLHLRHVSPGQLPQAYAKAINGMAIGPQATSFGAAAYGREPVASVDIRTDPLWDDYRELVAPFGFAACWSWPILSRRGDMLGALSLYSKEVGNPSASEIQVAGMATHIASIAIEHKRAEDHIIYMGHHDALTGLPNRTLLKDRLDQAILHGRRYDRLVTIVFIDLDNFKLINDTLGHNAGDDLLRVVARRLKQCVRHTDTVVRLGGDEFVIVLFDQPTKTETIASVIQKIIDTVSQQTMIDAHQIDISCSMGISTFPNDGDNTDTLLMNADAAMYRAKELGRNNFQFYTSSLNTKIHDRLAMQEGLRKAIACSEFLLLYQPQVDLQTRRIIGVEALIRWQHAQLGLLTPARFIALAEETGLIVPIGDWVLRTACKQNKAWQLRGFPPTTVSVNVSARQFREKDLVARVVFALQESELEPGYLELELTESLIMQDIDQAVGTMKQLTQMGIGLSIDDFGTGYSSLSALKNFPIVRLKIDQSFVRDIHTDTAAEAITKAVILLGHQLNLKVIAEGVETEDQLTFLRNNMCDEVQGYLLSKPVSPQEIEKLFLASDRPMSGGHNHNLPCLEP